MPPCGMMCNLPRIFCCSKHLVKQPAQHLRSRSSLLTLLLFCWGIETKSQCSTTTRTYRTGLNCRLFRRSYLLLFRWDLCEPNSQSTPSGSATTRTYSIRSSNKQGRSDQRRSITSYTKTHKYSIAYTDSQIRCTYTYDTHPITSQITNLYIAP